MSSYFDRTDTRIQDCNDPTELAKIEEKLVYDVTVCAMFPGFPSNLRLAIHEAILRLGVNSLPFSVYPADYETEQEHKYRIQRLSGDLHSIFHVAARMGLSDSPTYPLRRLASAGEEERDQMALGLPAYACECGRSWGYLERNASGELLYSAVPLLCPRCGKEGKPQGKTLGQYREETGYNVPAYECDCGQHWTGSEFCECGKAGIYVGTRGNVVGDGHVYTVR